MKITKLKIRNLFGVKEFESDGKDIELSGKNGVGKSAVIDAIRYALTNRSDREYIITRGETEGEVFIETDSGLRITRKPRTEKADYKSIRQGDGKAELGESFLREIFTELQLNPVEFASMDVKAQNRIILDLIDFKWDMNWIKDQFGEIPQGVDYDQNILCVLNDIQSEEGSYFLARQDINREVRNSQAFIEDIGKTLPPGYDAAKWDGVNLGDIYQRIEKIRAENDKIMTAKRELATKEDKAAAILSEMEAEISKINATAAERKSIIEKQISELESRLQSLKKDLDVLDVTKAAYIRSAKETRETKAAALEDKMRQYGPLAEKEPEDISGLQAEAKETELMKAFINEHRRMLGLQDGVVKLTEKAQALTEKIEKARRLPGEILANANIPISGLEIKDGVPLINGLPVSNLSDGEKMELCVSVAIHREGALKMILIDGIERLASARRDSVYALLKSKGVQFVATLTTDEDTLQVAEL